jgi:hypothetical protein
MRNTADVTGGKPIAVLLQSISGVSAINPLVAFYDIHGEVLIFYVVPDTTRNDLYSNQSYYKGIKGTTIYHAILAVASNLMKLELPNLIK